MKILDKLFLVLAILAMASPVIADDFIAVAKNGNIYDEASAKYVTVNQYNEDVSVIPGMVFATSQHTPGWYKVEYSPGIHAFLPEQITATTLQPVNPGTYDIQNLPGHKLTAQKNGDNWTATVDGKTFSGKNVQEMVIFVDGANKIAFSLVDLGSGPIAISYDNSVTKFF